MSEKNELVKHLYGIYQDMGRIPTTLHLRLYKRKPQYSEYVKVFGSWDRAITELKDYIKNEIHRKQA